MEVFLNNIRLWLLSLYEYVTQVRAKEVAMQTAEDDHVFLVSGAIIKVQLHFKRNSKRKVVETS